MQRNISITALVVAISLALSTTASPISPGLPQDLATGTLPTKQVPGFLKVPRALSDVPVLGSPEAPAPVSGALPKMPLPAAPVSAPGALPKMPLPATPVSRRNLAAVPVLGSSEAPVSGALPKMPLPATPVSRRNLAAVPVLGSSEAPAPAPVAGALPKTPLPAAPVPVAHTDYIYTQ
ncbi:hypothetical protein CF319_g7222 [Tilletia indica]|nr:hypothetical protein CF319_g7222 [Tilletia indica]